MKFLEYERGALHKHAVADIENKVLCEPADAMKFLRYEHGADGMKSLVYERGALHEHAMMKNMNKDMNTQSDEWNFEESFDHGALHGRAGKVVCLLGENDIHGAGVMRNMGPVIVMGLEAENQQTAPSMSEDRPVDNPILMGKTTLKEDAVRKITFSTLFKRAVPSPKIGKRKKLNMGSTHLKIQA
jgi:hypothetical protein